ncbi:hypothetical protein NLG97_g8150 [Lecanicillium saksenae]|uniref:Uncharacterized protein n=1 Tax=Lecanicillium saksenae TaxID=468837 RepID=A0ACC1QM49_9HYPO|nr:hypothetical protein NLG97_g8150 [Lecanicillium saksenae]
MQKLQRPSSADTPAACLRRSVLRRPAPSCASTPFITPRQLGLVPLPTIIADFRRARHASPRFKSLFLSRDIPFYLNSGQAWRQVHARPRIQHPPALCSADSQPLPAIAVHARINHTTLRSRASLINPSLLSKRRTHEQRLDLPTPWSVAHSAARALLAVPRLVQRLDQDPLPLLLRTETHTSHYFSFSQHHPRRRLPCIAAS